MTEPKFVVPASILALEDGLTKFNLILAEALKQGLLRPEDLGHYRRIWDRGRKSWAWSRHILDLLALLEDKAKERSSMSKSDYLKVKPLIEWWKGLGGRFNNLSPNDLREDQQAVLSQIVALAFSPTARVAFQEASGMTLDEEGWAALAVALAVTVVRSRRPWPAPPLSMKELVALDKHVPTTPPVNVGFIGPTPKQTM